MSARRWLVALVLVDISQMLFPLPLRGLERPTISSAALGDGRWEDAASSARTVLFLTSTDEPSARPEEAPVLGGVSKGAIAEDLPPPGGEGTHPSRVISLAPSVTEILFALGAGDEVVGVSTYCDYPPEATKIKRVGTFLTPNVEEIVALRPDVIIGVPTPGNEGPVRSLQDLGLKVVIVGGDTMRQMRESIDVIAQAIGRSDAGRDLLERLDARLAIIQARVQDAPARRVLMVVGEKPLVAVGSGTFPDELIRMAGGINVAGGTALAWPHVNIESVIAWEPEVIIDTSMGTEESARTLDFWKQFPSLPAVRDRRVYGFRSYQLLRPGPRIVDALDTLARTIHPERFEKAVQTPRSKVQGPRSGEGGIRFAVPNFGLWTSDLRLHSRDFEPWTLDVGQCLT